MKKFLNFHFPQNYQTYLTLFFATFITIIAVMIFLQISHFSQHFFKEMIVKYPLYGVLTPFMFVAIIYIVKYKCHLVGGSGIPQALAALKSHNKSIRNRLLSFRIATTKIIFIFIGMLFGAPIGIEGPSIHIGSSIFYNFSQFIQLKRKLLIHAFITIGGSIGLLVAFNSPLAAISFAFEEMGRELKKQAKILIVIIVAITFLALIFIRGNNPYLGNFNAEFEVINILQILPIVFICGIFGGVFAKLTIILLAKITGNKTKILSIVFILGSIVAILNYFSDGSISGSGHLETQQILSGINLGYEFAIMKFLATLSSVISAIPGGLFMPSIAIGAGIGATASEFINIDNNLIIILSMVAYLSAVIRTPWTASLVVLEMTNLLHLLPLALIIAFISNFISSKIQKKTLFTVLSEKFNYKNY